MARDELHRILELEVPRADESTVAGVDAAAAALRSLGFDVSVLREDGSFRIRLAIEGRVLDER